MLNIFMTVTRDKPDSHGCFETKDLSQLSDVQIEEYLELINECTAKCTLGILIAWIRDHAIREHMLPVELGGEAGGA